MKNKKRNLDPRPQYNIFGDRRVYETLVRKYVKAYKYKGATCRGRPVKLNPKKQVDIFFLHYRQDLTTRCIAHRYNVSKSLVANTIRKVEKFILDNYSYQINEKNEIVDNKDYCGKYIIDGTHICTSKHVYHKDLYSGKHKTSGYNVQVIGNTQGALLYLSQPFPGSYHDKKCYDLSEIKDYINPDHTLADKGYQGCGLVTPKKKGKNFTENDKKSNHDINQKRSIIERIISRIKNWKIIKDRYRRPKTTLPTTLKIITILEQLTTQKN